MNTNIKKSLIVLFCHLTYMTAIGQGFGTGLVLDKEKYEKVPLAAPLTQKSYKDIPYKSSLKKYCPDPGNQNNTGTCVGWTASYGARTIIESIVLNRDNTKIKSRQEINNNAFSPSFIYNQIVKPENNEDCREGIDLPTALDLLKQQGTVRMCDFPFENNCGRYPNIRLKQKALEHRIKDYQKLTLANKKDKTKVNKVRQALANKLPVIVGMSVDNNFQKLRHVNNTWQPSQNSNKESIAHAMLVIGYDDAAGVFELMNSWGTVWGNKGFIYVKYKDFSKYVHEAYLLTYNNIYTKEKMANKNNLSAFIDFMSMESEVCGKEINCLSGKDYLEVAKSANTYKLQKPQFSGSSYQIHLTPQTRNFNLYAFSIDKVNQVNLLFPFQEEVLSFYDILCPDCQVQPLIPYHGVTIVVPHESYCMQLDDNIETTICFLFAEQPLSIAEVIERLQVESGGVQERLERILGEQLILPNNVTYLPHRIGFQANKTKNKIVPVIVDMNHRDN